MDTAKRSQKLNCSRHFIMIYAYDKPKTRRYTYAYARSCISVPRSKVNVSHPISTSFFSSPQTLICINVRVLALMKLFTRPHSTADHQFYHNVWLHLTSKLDFFTSKQIVKSFLCGNPSKDEFLWSFFRANLFELQHFKNRLGGLDSGRRLKRESFHTT